MRESVRTSLYGVVGRKVRPSARGCEPSANQLILARWAWEEWGAVVKDIPYANYRGLYPGCAEEAARDAFATGALAAPDCGNYYDSGYAGRCFAAAMAHPLADQLRKGLFIELAARKSSVETQPHMHYLGKDREAFLVASRVAFARAVSTGKIYKVVPDRDGRPGLMRVFE